MSSPALTRKKFWEPACLSIRHPVVQVHDESPSSIFRLRPVFCLQVPLTRNAIVTHLLSPGPPASGLGPVLDSSCGLAHLTFMGPREEGKPESCFPHEPPGAAGTPNPLHLLPGHLPSSGQRLERPCPTRGAKTCLPTGTSAARSSLHTGRPWPCLTPTSPPQSHQPTTPWAPDWVLCPQAFLCVSY